MGFCSILFLTQAEELPETEAVFCDLELQQIFAAAEQERPEGDLAKLYRMPLKKKEEVCFRQGVMRDIIAGAAEPLCRFLSDMQAMRLFFAESGASNKYVSACKHLKGMVCYVRAVSRLDKRLAALPMKSFGMKRFQAELSNYIYSERFCCWQSTAENLFAELLSVHYMLHITDNVIEVCSFRNEQNLQDKLANLLGAFNIQEKELGKRRQESRQLEQSQVEEDILARLADVYPELFSRVQDFCEADSFLCREDFAGFEREANFYMSYLSVMDKCKAKGIVFSLPHISDTGREVSCEEGVDLALALHKDKVVGNSFFLRQEERIVVVTGPNQGGKTTFARMLGQLVYLASLGLPVPARRASIFLPGHIFTHFEQPENGAAREGRLFDDIERIYVILQQAVSGDLLIINEMLAAAAKQDALALGRKIIQQVADKGVFCVYVTFLAELAAFDERTVSMVSQVADSRGRRTYEIKRQKADGKGYTSSLVQSYHLTQSDVVRRIGANAGTSAI